MNDFHLNFTRQYPNFIFKWYSNQAVSIFQKQKGTSCNSKALLWTITWLNLSIHVKAQSIESILCYYRALLETSTEKHFWIQVSANDNLDLVFPFWRDSNSHQPELLNARRILRVSGMLHAKLITMKFVKARPTWDKFNMIGLGQNSISPFSVMYGYT